jgi:hypothetical protein
MSKNIHWKPTKTDHLGDLGVDGRMDVAKILNGTNSACGSLSGLSDDFHEYSCSVKEGNFLAS